MTPATDSELHDLVARIVGEVPGLVLHRAERVSVPGAGGLTAARIMGLDVRATGWSPTLHERNRAWRIAISDQPGGEDAPYVELTGKALGARIRHLLKDRLKAQRGLAAAARVSDIAHPRGLPDAAAGRFTVGHLHTTRASLDLMVRRLGADAALADICTRVANLVGRAEDKDSESILMDLDGDIAAVLAGVPAFQPMERIAGNRVTLRGTILTVREAIPDTLIDALPGRPVRTVVETGVASLDDATIVDAAVNEIDGGNVITVALDTIQIDRHPDLSTVLRAHQTANGKEGRYP